MEQRKSWVWDVNVNVKWLGLKKKNKKKSWLGLKKKNEKNEELRM